MTDQESLQADRDLAARILWAVWSSPYGTLTREELYHSFQEHDRERIDVIVDDDLADCIDGDDDVSLTREAAAKIGAAATAACRALVEGRAI